MDGLDLSAGEGLAGLVGRGIRGRKSRRLKLASPFLWFVLAPTAIAAFYDIAIATPQYVSEAQFVVRGQSSQSTGALSGLLATAGASMGGATQDTYAVQAYMTSRDAAARLIKTENLRAVFARPEADFLARFPNFAGSSDFEHFYWHYKSHVTAELDTDTGLSTLTVRTFRPGDSERIASALLAAGEQLINEMNARQRDNTIKAATDEIAGAETHLRQIEDQVAAYRNREAMIDPLKQSVPMLKDISDLESLLTSTRIQLAQLLATAPNSPLVPVYQHKITALQHQILTSNANVTGSSTSLVPKLTSYDELSVQKELVEKELAADATALVAAKAQADRQLVYLDEVVAPNLPDYAAYPKILIDIAVVFASFLGLYLLGRLIVAGAKEHQIV